MAPQLVSRSLLVVEDDEALRFTIAEQLLMRGDFEPTRVDSAAATETMLASPDTLFDVILLDIGLPDENGRQFCARMRERGVRVLIVLITGHDAERDVVRGLAAGSNDCIAKPPRIDKLEARLRAHLRGFDSSEHAAYVIGPYISRPVSRLLTSGTRKVRLTEKECRLLRSLHAARGQVVKKGHLRDQIWGYNKRVTTHTPETHICRLRQTIEPNPALSSLFATGTQDIASMLSSCAE
jgi:DNA-binding response OmpR family regulator